MTLGGLSGPKGEDVIHMKIQQKADTTDLVNIIFKAIAVALSVASVVMQALGAGEVNTHLILLGLSIFALATAGLNKK